MNSGWAVVIGTIGGGLVTGITALAATWLNAHLTRTKPNPSDEAAKELLRSMLNRPRWGWANIKTLANVVGTDEATVRRLLLEIGARGSMRDPHLWGLVSRNPIYAATRTSDDPDMVEDGLPE